MDKFKGDRLGLILAFWGLGVVLGRPLVSQNDNTEDGQVFGECVDLSTADANDNGTAANAFPIKSASNMPSTAAICVLQSCSAPQSLENVPKTMQHVSFSFLHADDDTPILCCRVNYQMCLDVGVLAARFLAK